MGGIDAQAHDVHRVPRPRYGYFHAIDQPHARGVCGLAGLFQAARLVVIGQRQDIHAALRGASYQRRRRQQPVGNGRMRVQVDDHEVKGVSRQPQ